MCKRTTKPRRIDFSEEGLNKMLGIDFSSKFDLVHMTRTEEAFA